MAGPGQASSVAPDIPPGMGRQERACPSAAIKDNPGDCPSREFALAPGRAVGSGSPGRDRGRRVWPGPATQPSRHAPKNKGGGISELVTLPNAMLYRQSAIQIIGQCSASSTAIAASTLADLPDSLLRRRPIFESRRLGRNRQAEHAPIHPYIEDQCHRQSHNRGRQNQT